MSGKKKRGRKRTLMRKKSWLRQASRDRRPRRTQSSMSPNYNGITAMTMEGETPGSEQKEGRPRTTEGNI